MVFNGMNRPGFRTAGEVGVVDKVPVLDFVTDFPAGAGEKRDPRRPGTAVKIHRRIIVAFSYTLNERGESG